VVWSHDAQLVELGVGSRPVAVGPAGAAAGHDHFRQDQVPLAPPLASSRTRFILIFFVVLRIIPLKFTF
jgi:hypothetical protein